MMRDLDRFIVEGNVHGDCDLCRLAGSINRVVGDYHLCRGCIETVDTRADSRVSNPDTEHEDIEEAFVAVLDEHAGANIILHYPTGDSPTKSHTHTVKGVEDFEVEFGDQNEVHVRHVGGDTATYTGTGLTVSGMNL